MARIGSIDDFRAADGGWRRALVRLARSEGGSGGAVDFVVVAAPGAAAPHGATVHAIEATCPHSGGPLHLGDIEDLGGPHAAIVCPWHEFRFALADGSCSTTDALCAETPTADILPDGSVTIDHKRLPVVADVRFFDVSERRPNAVGKAEPASGTATRNAPNAAEGECRSLVDYAIAVLNTADPAEKVALTFKAAELWSSGAIDEVQPALDMQIALAPSDQSHRRQIQSTNGAAVPDQPARHDDLGFVAPGKAKKLGKGGTVESRIAILHSLANIEQWAIDLAWDIIARFATCVAVDPESGSEEPLPWGFFSDFVRVASDEATHFSYLIERLEALGSHFGALPVHGGLWDSATDTKDSLAARLAIVHMVHEARGLDVNPQTIEKFRRAGDAASVEKLVKIHEDEITHVACGQRWFSWMCSIERQDRYARFHALVRQHFRGLLKPPFNDRDRLVAGLDSRYYMPLTAAAE
ncbi:hypothetical protein HK105_205420 [Polyrhizophydium stewartii]|uniref:Rieske domain-containing protein n=1 Tax=Polyrhizophydium stewartii TaxID=2732419 RepID=A0ABR4N6D4_9FUNG|nr:hypothetical protein HK105_006110 [Polyrhizophydium stewartii]